MKVFLASVQVSSDPPDYLLERVLANSMEDALVVVSASLRQTSFCVEAVRVEELHESVFTWRNITTSDTPSK